VQVKEDMTAPGGRHCRITSIVVCTYERVDALLRALTSYAENTKRSGRRVQIVVIDQARTSDMRAACRDRLRALARQFDVPVAYAGVEEKQRFATSLHETTSIPTETISFGLFGQFPGDEFAWASRIGSQRNCALLQTAGENILCVDDDTECRPFGPPAPEDRPRLSQHCDPGDYWFFGDLAQAIAFAPPVDVDILTEHEDMLGSPPRVADLREIGSPAPWPNASDTPLRDRLGREDARAARVMMSYNGLVGDCGWGSPFGYWAAPLGSLILEEASHARLVRSKESYAAALGTRIILHVPAAPTVSDASSIGAFFGLDNRDLVPPFLPVQRGEDMIFARMLWRSMEESCFGHLPTALLHAPVDARRFTPRGVTRSASGYDLTKLVVDCVLSCRLEPGRGSIRDRLRLIGEHLIDLGMLPTAEFDRRIRTQARLTMGEFTEWMLGHLKARAESADYWKKDVTRYVDAARQAMAAQDCCVPLDLAQRHTFEQARVRAQRVVSAFGRLCVAWPALVDGVRELQARGTALAPVLH
jgi:hypothetical protein